MSIIPDNILKRMSTADRASYPKQMTAEEALLRFEAKSEKELQQQIEAFLTLREVLVVRQRMDKKSNVKVGCPDILFVEGGIAYAFEVKLPGKLPTDEQARAMKQMTENGWRCWVVNSLQQVKEILDR